MFAKLVIGASDVYATGIMRDIGRLITSATPSTSLLQTFNVSSSVVYDSTPAGWTYVGSNHAADQPTIADGSTQFDGTHWNFCFSAPCLSGSALKYCILTSWQKSSITNAGVKHGFTLIGASSASSSGVVTNEGPRPYYNGTSQYGYDNVPSAMFSCGSTVTFYVIASARHLTIIQNSLGMAAIWESSMTNAHSYYGTAPFISLVHHNIPSVSVIQAVTAPTSIGQTATWGTTASAYNVTDPNTGTNYGVYDLATNNLTGFHLVQSTTSTTLRSSTIDSGGNPKYVVQPIFYSMDKIGYPTQYVTGIVPIYFTKAGIGNTGDTISVNGTNYTFIDVSTKFGLIVNVTG